MVRYHQPALISMMTQTTGKDVLKHGPWRGYMGTKATPGKVRELFYKRYGYMPKKVFRSGCIMIAGPIPAKVVTDETRQDSK